MRPCLLLLTACAAMAGRALFRQGVALPAPERRALARALVQP